MKKSRALSALVSVYTALWFMLDGAWFFKWQTITAVLSILVVSLALSALFLIKRTQHAILLSAAEFSWILFNVFWIRFDLGEVQWCQPVALTFFVIGLLCLIIAVSTRTLSKVQQPFDGFIFRRLKI